MNDEAEVNREESAEAVSLPPVAEEAEPAPAATETIAQSFPLSWMVALRSAFGIGLLFALVGSLLGLHEVAQQILPHILTSGNAADFQETTEGLPIPRLLDWNPTRLGWLQLIGDMNIYIASLFVVVLFTLLLLCAILALNPTFRILRIRHSAPILHRMIFNAAALTKAFRASLPAGLFYAVVWLITRFLEPRFSGFVGEIRVVAAGMALWIAFAVRGKAGDFDSAEIRTSRGAMTELLLMGALFGLAAYVMAQVGMPRPLGRVLSHYQMLGTFHRGYAWFIGGRYLLSLSAIWFGVGVLLLALGQPQLRASQRLGLSLFSLLATFLAVQAQRPFQPEVMASRLDMTPAVTNTILMPYSPRIPASGVPQGLDAAQELAKRANITTQARPPDRAILLFAPRGAATLKQIGLTIDGLPADPATVTRVQDFLAKRDYETALSWTAVRHLFDVHTAAFDTTAAISDLLLDLTHCPHLWQCDGTLSAMFFTCAATPQNLALLDQYADTQQFAHPDRESLRRTGNLYLRFGATEKALVWYRRADMPKTFLHRVMTEKPMFHQGRISGVLRFNGKPLVGATLAAEPFRLNGLPPDLEYLVYANGQEILETPIGLPQTERYSPSPFSFRYLSTSTTTDASGNFVLSNLIEGQYWLICRLPAGIVLRTPVDTRLHLTNNPHAISMNYAHPTQDVGTIELNFMEAQRP